VGHALGTMLQDILIRWKRIIDTEVARAQLTRELREVQEEKLKKI
jgi:valyl-tRNA synthetase